MGLGLPPLGKILEKAHGFFATLAHVPSRARHRSPHPHMHWMASRSVERRHLAALARGPVSEVSSLPSTRQLPRVPGLDFRSELLRHECFRPVDALSRFRLGLRQQLSGRQGSVLPVIVAEWGLA